MKGGDKMACELKLIEESIEHWVRMLEWAKKQDPSRHVRFIQMISEIGEDWYSDSCPLCRRFRSDARKKCPLEVVFGCCDNSLSMNVWKDVSRAGCWGEWVACAGVMVEQLKTVFKLYKMR